MPTIGTIYVGGIDPTGPSPFTVARSSTDVTVQNTTAETDLLAVTVNAFVLQGDRGLRVTIWGVRINSSGGTVAYRFRVYYGATVLWEHVASFFTTSASCPFQAQFELRAKDADDAQEMDGRISIHSGGSPDAGEGSIALGMDVDSIIHGESVEDANTELDFRFTVEMDVADAAALIQARRSLVELI